MMGVETAQNFQFMCVVYFFESVCTGAADEVVDSNVGFCSVVSLHLGTHNILLAAEIGCEENGNYKELKTMK